MLKAGNPLVHCAFGSVLDTGWAPPEFAKCWPVSNRLQKNVKSPRLAPPGAPEGQEEEVCDGGGEC